MVSEGIPFKNTGYFSKLISDYLDQDPGLESFYGRFSEIESFGAQIQEKTAAFTPESRKILHRVIAEQYRHIETTEPTESNIESLLNHKTFTVVTGHQLNLFTGPLYFHYKILTTIKLCNELAEQFPGYNFVPVYWMATEDHDFEEINHFSFKGKKFRWNREAKGAVGRLSTEGLADLFQALGKDLVAGRRADDLRELFEKAYLKHENLAQATRFLVNALFGKFGLVILDADDSNLKRLFLPHLKQDVFDQLGYKEVINTIAKLQEIDPGYSAQVNPREINLFYLDHDFRSRLVADSAGYRVLDSQLSFSAKELENLMDAHPEKFSPNVITRPLYQEVILPNLCYVGGAGEIAYWLELKSYFEASGIPFPILLLRNSALLISEKQHDKAKRLGLRDEELFLNQNRLVNKKIREISNVEINFDAQRKTLLNQFKLLYGIASETDASFLGAVKAQEKKQLKGLENLEKRLLTAQKKKLKDHVDRLVALHSELFPGGGLQERSQNFAEFYLELGPDWTSGLLECFDPLALEFSLIRY